MVIPNRISEEVTQQTIDDVMAALATIHTALPFLVGLSPKERMRMNKAGDASQAFIRKSADLAPLIEGQLPRDFDIAEFHKDIVTMDALRAISLAVGRLSEMLSDTRAVLASEAYSAALKVYRCAKEAKGPLGMEGAVKDLGRRFTQDAQPPLEGPAPDPTPDPTPDPAPTPTPGPTAPDPTV